MNLTDSRFWDGKTFRRLPILMARGVERYVPTETPYWDIAPQRSIVITFDGPFDHYTTTLSWKYLPEFFFPDRDPSIRYRLDTPHQLKSLVNGEVFWRGEYRFDPEDGYTSSDASTPNTSAMTPS